MPAKPLRRAKLRQGRRAKPSQRTSNPAPQLFEASTTLRLESTLSELSLYAFQVEADRPSHSVAEVFEQHPSVPGVIVLQEERFWGMISRQRLLEFLIRPHGFDIVMTQPLAVLYRYAETSLLILPHTTPILSAAQQALRRSPIHQGEPIVVQIDPHTFRLLNVHELHIAYWQLRGIETQVRYERAQTQMIQIEKMASLGRLVDGVSHEILDPVGFIWGNLSHVSSYIEQLMQLLAAYEAAQPPDAIAHLEAEIELDYLRHDLPSSIASIKTGAERLKNLAASLQNFCHIDEIRPKPADLHECLDSILLLLKSRLSGEIEIVRNYSSLPPVTCFAGQLSQVFINILTNAIDALINQAVHRELTAEFGSLARSIDAIAPKPQITIFTQVREAHTIPELRLSETAHHGSRWISVRIADNSPGLSIEQQQQIVEAFSLEKRAAKETSLAVSYRIITAKHGGKLLMRSSLAEAVSLDATHPVLDSGTEFEILLPLI